MYVHKIWVVIRSCWSKNKKRLLEFEASQHLIYLFCAEKVSLLSLLSSIFQKPIATKLPLLTHNCTDLFTFTLHLMPLHHFITYLFNLIKVTLLHFFFDYIWKPRIASIKSKRGHVYGNMCMCVGKRRNLDCLNRCCLFVDFTLEDGAQCTCDLSLTFSTIFVNYLFYNWLDVYNNINTSFVFSIIIMFISTYPMLCPYSVLLHKIYAQYLVFLTLSVFVGTHDTCLAYIFG